VSYDASYDSHPLPETAAEMVFIMNRFVVLCNNYFRAQDVAVEGPDFALLLRDELAKIKVVDGRFVYEP
jgi:hypothetical protein